MKLALQATLILFFFTGSAQASGDYRSFDIASLKIIVDSEWASQTAPGYLPVRVDIINEGDERTIEVFAQGNRFRSFGGPGGSVSMDIRQALHLKRGDRVRVTIPLPIQAENENVQLQIREGGRTLQAMGYTGLMSGKSPEESPVLLIVDPATPFGMAATNLLRPMKTPSRYYYVAGPRGSAPKLDFILGPTRVPTNWLGFTSLRGVLLGGGEWDQLTAAQKSALLAYVACGGKLMLIDGNLNQLFPGAPGGTSVTRYLFGTVQFPRLEDVTEKGLDPILTAASSNDSAWTLPANHEPEWGWIAEKGFRLPIPGVAGVPIRAYLAILVLFSLLIGPANFILLWRKRQQVLLVLTVPLISVLFIAVLAGYAIAGEGFGVRARSETFTVLDQDSKQAATRASVSLYAAGMTPSGGLRFPRDMAVFPIGTDGRGSEEPESLDLTDLQQFSSGIVRARTPTNFEEIGYRAARERLSFSGETGQMTVVNGLGATVQRLLFREGGKTYVSSQPVQPGEKSVLTAGGADSAGKFFAEVSKSAVHTSRAIREASDNLKDGSYLAVLDHSPFWDAGVPSIDERGSFHLVMGLAGGQP